MAEKDIHMQFRDVASVNLLFAALDRSFPLFRSVNETGIVDSGGKESGNDVFLTLKAFSTNFPQQTVDEKQPIL